MNNLQQAYSFGQAVWVDYLRRGFLDAGELARLIEQGVSGVTANPSIFEKAISASADYDEALIELLGEGKSLIDIYEELVFEDIRQAADALSPVYEMTEGDTGYVSIELNPHFARNTAKTLTEAKRLIKKLSRPNIMVKIPATKEGIKALGKLTAEGINTNATLVFSVKQYREIAEVYIKGLEERKNKGRETDGIFSVASFFLSRVDAKADKLLSEKEASTGKLKGKTAISLASLAYKEFQEVFNEGSFDNTLGRKQKLLWASTSVKNPHFDELHYANALVGKETVCTMPLPLIRAFIQKGEVKERLGASTHSAEKTLQKLASLGINTEEIAENLLSEGIDTFKDSFDKTLQGLEKKAQKLLDERRMGQGENLGEYLYDVETILEELNQANTIERMWCGDYTVWGKDPAEISDRLGWLTIPDKIKGEVERLKEFALEIKDEGFTHVVLLGMGGSSLGAEVLRSLYKRKEGYPELIILDSIIPEAVLDVTGKINPQKTLFIVSSKSGTTMETNLLYKYFKHLTEDFSGGKPVGRSFTAITDEGTPLAKLAVKEGFRALFIDPFDIGGRYSVLSYFGLLPAVLMGIEISEMLERASYISEACQPCVPIMENPGAFLGVTMGVLTGKKVDKLTLITSPKMGRFGLWVEQLIAESTGKDLKGIIPVTTEPLMEAGSYSADRFFIYLRLKVDKNKQTDLLVEELKKAGRPIMILKMEDAHDIGAEFFRWQFAVATAASVMQMNPFNQPDVQRAKEESSILLEEYKKRGNLPSLESNLKLKDLLIRAQKGSYLAIMAYMKENSRCTEAVAELRRKITGKYGIATTFGYGPRFLHSTGQLYKGGPDTGLFFQLTTHHERDIPAIGEDYTFGVVSDAQAMGDYKILKELGRSVATLKTSEAEAEKAIHIEGELI